MAERLCQAIRSQPAPTASGPLDVTVSMGVSGIDGLGWEGEGFTPADIAETRGWLRSKGNSIEGGTSEVQLNVIAKRVLGLPD